MFMVFTFFIFRDVIPNLFARISRAFPHGHSDIEPMEMFAAEMVPAGADFASIEAQN